MSGRPIAPPNAARVIYDATDNGVGADGIRTFTIHNIPICGELAAGERNNPKKISKDWMESVIATHLSELVRGFVSPIHAAHNKLTEAVALGTFVPMAVRRAICNGAEQWCLFADLTVDQDSLAAIRAGQYPYRSIEVDWDNNYIGSLALLAGVSPHFRLPMLRDVRILNEGATPDPVPAMAATLLSAMATASTVPHRANFVAAPVHLRHSTLVRMESYAKEGEDAEGAADMADKGTDGPPQKGAADAADPATEESAVAKGIAGIAAICTRILEAVTGGKKTEDRLQPARDEHPEDSGEATGDEGEDDNDDAPEGKKPTKEKDHMGASTTTLDAATTAKLAQLDSLAAKVTTLEGEKTALELKVTALETANAAATKTAALVGAKARLSAKRVVLPADFDARFGRAYDRDAALAEDVVVMLETSGRKDPPETFHGAMHLDGVTSDAPEMTAYLQCGNPALLEQARKVQSEYRAHKAASPGSDTTLAQMLQIKAPIKATA